ncbi:MAG: NADH-quinone oxidoreductase subunit NuoN [Betaproteobacteria bacterium]|jgi:NADH-quinone oxidoreductase subunit N|nr:NADH-quinone oxidoreductase subunit NuoN [Betaproteobacteria bacterium]
MPMNLAAVMPEIALLTAACAILVLDLFLRDERRAVSYWLTQAALLGTAWYVLATANAASSRAFGNMVVDDMLTDLLKLAALLAVSAGLFYGRQYLAARGLFRGETFVLMLFAALGMMVMISANHFLLLYLGLELMSLSLYALVALHRGAPSASEAAMKYFVLGAMASGLFLYGTSMIYGATGTFDVDLAMRATLAGSANRLLLVVGLVFALSGIAFKLGAVPYHMWVPDVYQGAATPVTLLIGTAPKLAAFALTLRVLAGALAGVEFDWQRMLIVLALLSMVLGNFTAIAQTSVKRMLAYSTIANMGFMLMGFLAADLNGLSAALFYAITYVLTSLAAFGVILLLTREGFECERLDDLRGLNRRSPWWAFIMLLAMFSLAGVPPTVGFYAKFAVIEAAVNAQYVWLAVAAVLASLVGAFYYLRVVKLMYFDDPVDDAPIEARGDAQAILSVNGLALLALGILPQPLMGLCAVALMQAKFL